VTARPPVLVGRCALHGAHADPVGEVIAALRSGEKRDYDAATVLAYFDAARDPYHFDRIRLALAEHEARKDP